MQSPPILTTVFTPPPSCASILTYNGATFWRGQLSSTGDPDCYPPLYSQAWWYYYSPGVCPSGWDNASSVTGAGALVTNTAETNAICCPDSYFVGTGPSADQNGLFCASILTGILTNVYSTSTQGFGGIPENPSLVTIDVATVTSPTVWADIIQIRWQSTDSEVLEIMSSERNAASSIYTPSQASSRTTPSIPPNTSTSSLTPQSATTTPDTLSTSAKARLGDGVSVAVFLFVVSIYWWCRRQRKPSFAPKAFMNTYSVAVNHELDARYNERPFKGELDGTANLELASQIEPIELPTTNLAGVFGRS